MAIISCTFTTANAATYLGYKLLEQTEKEKATYKVPSVF